MNATGFRSRVAVLALVAVLAGPAAAQTAPDYAREKRWADEVVPSLVVGEAVALKTDAGRGFLGILTRSPKARGAVVLVHGVGVHPDFGLIGELRTRLADRGLTTLSIQMPVLAADASAEDYPQATFAEAGERIAAGVGYLRAKGGKVALVSHSMGARMAEDWLRRNPKAPLAAWVPVAILSGGFEGIGSLSFPVFDVYAQNDLEPVVRGAKGRAAVLRSIPGSRQAMVYGTDHYFARKERELAALIQSLLDPVMR